MWGSGLGMVSREAVTSPRPDVAKAGSGLQGHRTRVEEGCGGAAEESEPQSKPRERLRVVYLH